jgi:hypothetical protein
MPHNLSAANGDEIQSFRVSGAGPNTFNDVDLLLGVVVVTVEGSTDRSQDGGSVVRVG